jgi:CheY-like chemotaxis protein
LLLSWEPLPSLANVSPLCPKRVAKRFKSGSAMPRILVIDDNEDVRGVVCGVLESEGYDAIRAADGAQGVRMQRESRAALVITDIFMPDKEGLETIRDLRHEFPDLKIIAMSGGGSRVEAASSLAAAKEFGAQAVLQKPFEPSALLKTVHEVLKQPPE